MRVFNHDSGVVFVAFTGQIVFSSILAAWAIEAGRMDVAIPLLLVAVFCGANIAVIEVLA